MGGESSKRATFKPLLSSRVSKDPLTSATSYLIPFPLSCRAIPAYPGRVFHFNEKRHRNLTSMQVPLGRLTKNTYSPADLFHVQPFFNSDITILSIRRSPKGRIPSFCPIPTSHSTSSDMNPIRAIRLPRVVDIEKIP